MLGLFKTWMTPKFMPLPPSALRKMTSEQQLLQQGVRIDPKLPCLPTVEACQFRSVKQIVGRLQSLMLLTAYAEELPKGAIESLSARTHSQESFTLTEQHWLANTKPSEEEKQAYMWRYESIKVLLWALGYQAELGKPSEIADIIELSRLIQWQTYDELLAGARPLSQLKILDMADMYYRMAYVGVRQPRALPANVSPCMVRERQACLSWLIGETDWDARA